ncbi:MAG: AbrB family transcriptional regulator [Bacillota bacterium]
MSYSILGELFILVLIGIMGWYLFALIHAPVAPLLGALTLLGALKAAGVNLPPSPAFFTPAIQGAIGLFVGSRITRDTIRDLKSAVIPAILIAVWALAVVFVIGGFLAKVTHLDIYTAMLSSSMGGLPEMAVLAIATNTEVTVVIIMFTFRMVISILIFPLIFKYWIVRNDAVLLVNESANPGLKGKDFDIRAFSGLLLQARTWQQGTARCLGFFSSLLNNTSVPVYPLTRVVFTLGMAAGGAFLFYHLGVPAGIMIGAMIFSVISSLLGAGIQFCSPGVFALLLVGVGIMIADNISTNIIDVLLAANLAWPMLLSTLLIFVSSFGVAFVIHKLSGWDFPTSFLASAPAGLTIMTSLAISYGKNPLHISTLHLWRLIVLKTAVPLIFMLII